MNGLIAVVLGFVITAITSVIPNQFLPMLLSPYPSMGVDVGITYTGYPIPFMAKIGGFQFISELDLVLDIVIITLIIWVIGGIIEDRKFSIRR